MTPSETESNESTASSVPDLSEAIEKLMAHPEILQMAASVLGQGTKSEENPVSERLPTAPSGETPSDDKEIPDSSAEAPENSPAADAQASASVAGALPDLMKLVSPMLKKGGGGHHHGKDLGRCTALLIALKPYLSPERCSTVDKIVQMSKLGEVLDKLL